MKKTAHTVKLWAALLFMAVNSPAADFFVSPTGSDSNLGTISQPFATIQKAADSMFAGDTCHIRAGTYRETVTPPRSGSAGSPIRYQSYSNESVTVTGLDPVSGWSLLSNEIYQCSAPVEITQLFADGELMVEARWPNTGPDYLTPTLAIVDSASTGSYLDPITLTDSALSSFSDGFWNGAKMWYLPGDQWGAGSTTITSHSSNQLTFPNTSKVDALQIEAGSKYFLYGTLNALNVQTEWVHENGQLYFKAPGFANPSNLLVEGRTRRYGFDLAWRNYTEIEGITFRAASIQTKGSHNLIENCTILYPTPFFDPAIWQGDTGVVLNGQNNTIRKCEIAWSWGDGISLENSALSNTVDNCLIHDCNWAGSWSAPIRTMGSGHRFTGNTIYNCGRSGIRFQRASSLIIESNHVSHVGWLTKDLGSIKTGGTDGQGTIIRHNWMRDHNSAAWCTGIYLDNSSTNYIVHNNVVWNHDNGLRMNKSSADIQAYNNTFFNSSKEDMAQYAPGGEVLTNVKTYNNIGTTGPFRGTDLQNNLLDTESNFDFAGAAHGDFRLLEGSTAMDYGRSIPGYTDGHAGAAPDAGAYEFSGTDWVAGIDWTPDWNSPPSPAFSHINDTFDASASTDTDGFIMRYDWDFGDGNSGYGKTVAHTYASTGTYDVVLTVLDELGGTRTATNPVTIDAISVFASGTDLFMESDGTKHDTDTLLAGKPVFGTDPLDARRSFLKFNLTGMDNAPISSAVLRLYHVEGVNDTYGNAQIHPVTSNWDFSSVSFDQPVGSSLGTLVGKDGPFNQYHELDLTTLVESWQADPSSNHGLSIRGSELNGFTAEYFQSFEGANPPQLVITYLDPTRFSAETDLFMESDGTKYDTDTLLAGKPVSGTDPLDAIRAFLKFDLSAMYGLPISNAVLRLYHIEGENDTWGSAFLYEVTSNWNFSSVTFDQPVGPSLGKLVENTGPFNQYIEFDITDLVQGWQADPVSNHGLSIRGNESNGVTAKYFQSAEGANPPEIFIVYGAAPQPAVTPSITPGAEPILSWEGLLGADYTIERCDDLVEGNWTNIAASIEGTPPLNVYTDAPASGLEFPLYYRITAP